MKAHIAGDFGFFELEVELPHRLTSTAFICPHCLRLWAQVKVYDGDQFSLEPTSCERCNRKGIWKNPIPGSILDHFWRYPPEFDVCLLHLLPEPLLRRELVLHLKATENALS